MQQYRVIYSDELTHHGILGMHWGIRRFQNKDGSLTSAGRERYGVSEKTRVQVREKINESYFVDKNKADKVFKMIDGDKEKLNLAKKEIEEGTKKIEELAKQDKELFKELDSNKGMKAYYEAASEIASFHDYRGDVDNLDLRDIGNAGFMGCLEDGQQSKINAYSMYANEKGFEDKAVNLQMKSGDAQREMINKASEHILDAFKDVGIDDLTVSDKSTYLSGKRLAEDMFDTKYFSDFEKYSTYRSDDVWKLDNRDKLAIEKARKIVDHIKGNNDPNTWWYFSEAVENLGMSSNVASKLSQSDWDRINEEIRELRAND